jgi:hypothetical protein
MEDIQDFNGKHCLLSSHLKLQCKYFLIKMATQIKVQGNPIHAHICAM